MTAKRLGVIFLITMITISSVLAWGCSGTATPAPSLDPTAGYLQVHITDAAKAPLAGAKVVSQTQPQGQLKVDGLTDQDGLVTFSKIAPGKYEFAISQADSKPTVAVVNLAAGQPVEITIAMEKASTP